ncbi:quercetin 2,3-dioxygenase [Microterricola viridarii]|uniref:Cupin n=1 Tax=Microterricola viridarii TaxID=412690 RepID=A0A109QWA9_9MICO|nr:quercetin 2,3-dioxygenase [Microterricola viridarii]AMB57604.1 cupin [Microterricola viridarii]
MASTLLEPGAHVPIANALPGAQLPYVMAAGHGERFLLNGQLLTVIARPVDTGDLFGAAYLSGGRGAELPATTDAAEHRTVIVFDGLVQVWLGSETSVLSPGDEVVIPAGTPFAYRMLAGENRLLLWSSPGHSLELLSRLGTPTASHVRPARAERLVSLDEFRAVGEEFGVDVTAAPLFDAARQPAAGSRHAGLPREEEAFFLSAGEGERYLGADEMHSYMSRGANTGGRYFAVESSGARSGYIPLHFHREHTENFICLDGRVRLHVNGREVLLSKGDFVHAPAGTIHSYAYETAYARMVGVLAPSIFEPFFEYVFSPTEESIYTEGGVPGFIGPGFGRAQAELDLVVVGPPPERVAGLDI